MFSPTGSFEKGTFEKGTLPDSQYVTPASRAVLHQTTPEGVEYAVSSKTASMASLNEPPPEYVYAAVDKKKVITTL